MKIVRSLIVLVLKMFADDGILVLLNAEVEVTANYIGYTSRHLHLRIEEHKYSVIGKHLKDQHDQRPNNLHEQFTILKKCRGKFECLIYEMLLIRKKRPTLNTQKDSIPAKLFI